MPMIDVYASEVTFGHPHDLARDLLPLGTLPCPSERGF
jgi:hypothetical protein